jgi:Reverse transcriptase (RNA-dependent DNA polymerase)
MFNYEVFGDLGNDRPPPSGYKKIPLRMIYDIKHDGRHKARLVAGGHLTPIPIDSIYSGVVSLRGLRIVIFLAEHNKLVLWGADVTCAYLEAGTKELVYFIAGREFGPLAGHTMIVLKALYGLRSSGLRWHEHFADILRSLGFLPSKAESDIWMRVGSNVYEYIAVYVDDIAIAAKDPMSIIQALKDKHKLQLKGVGPIEFHLGCNFQRDEENTLYYGPKTYIEKMVANFERYFGEKPKDYTSPLEKNDHPELDDSELLDTEGLKLYQSMIGALQWAVSLGRFDIHTAVMTMSKFRMSPRHGHLNRLKRIYGYLRAAIRINTAPLDVSHLQDVEYDWEYSVYGNVKEQIPADLPKALGNHVMLTHYVDANLFHDLITGRAVTGVLHFMNQTPVEWYSKKQATVETATYGSEFVAARIAVDQIIDLRTTLRYLGVPIEGKSYLFGDNQSVITSSTLPQSSLKKRHNALSYHRVRESIAAKIVAMFKIDGVNNYGDILSKHYGYQQAWPLIKPLLFWRGYMEPKGRTNLHTKGESQPKSKTD